MSSTTVALLGGAGAAVAGFLVALVIASIVWLKAGSMSYGSFIHAGTSMWLLAHGASTTLGGVRLGIMPLGMTSLVALAVAGAAHRAAVRRASEPAADATQDATPAGGVLHAAAPVVVAYLVMILVLGAAGGAIGQAVRALPGALVIVGGAALTGARGPLGWRPWRSWPVWARALPTAGIAALLTLLAGSGVAAGLALAEHWHRVATLQASLNPGASGGIALLALQLAYLPNVVVWAGSWMLGAGFALGHDTLVTPVTTRLGLLPSIPVLGAVPGPGNHSQLHLAWLLVGVLAGVIAALLASGSPGLRWSEGALAGGLAGLASALVFVLVAWLSGGPLGSGRLAHVGPRQLPLTLLAGSVLTLAGAVAGGVLVSLRRSRQVEQPEGGATSAVAQFVTPQGDPAPRLRFGRRIEADHPQEDDQQAGDRPAGREAQASDHARDPLHPVGVTDEREQAASSHGRDQRDWLQDEADEPTRDIHGRGRAGGSSPA